MTEERLERLEKAADKMADAVDRFERALVGAPDEGNKGVLPRLDTMEKQVRALWFMSPLLVAGGAAIGQLLSGFLGA